MDLSGLMRVLGEALYSTPHVAIRELVQNAHDSCTRRLVEMQDAFEPQIRVTASPTALTITDNGIGLTAPEIHAFLATVGAGNTGILRDKGAGDDLIGYFGLGFLSAFAIGERVDVWTCSSTTPHVAHRFVSRSGETYTVDEAERRPVGTEVRVTLRPEYPELGDPEMVLGLLRRYCRLLKHPVSLGEGPPVNTDRPPWRTAESLSPLRLKALALSFAREFERVFEPLVTFPLPGGDGEVAGLLWVQDGGSYATSDNRNVSVFVRGMLISDDERELLPRWAGFVGGVVESSSLQPTASRESLRKDEAYQRIARRLQEHLVDSLARLAKDDRATWQRVMTRHNEALLGASLADPGLHRVLRDELTVPTTEGDLTLPEILRRSDGRIYVTHAEGRGGLESALMHATRRPVVRGTRYAAASFCTRYATNPGDLVILGTRSGDQALFQPSDLTEVQSRELEEWFAASGREVLVRRFEPAYLPFAVLVDREAELKHRLESDEANRRIGQSLLHLARQFTNTIDARVSVRMYVNSANPIVRALSQASPERRSLALGALEPLTLVVTDQPTPADLERSIKNFTAAMLSILEVK